MTAPHASHLRSADHSPATLNSYGAGVEDARSRRAPRLDGLYLLNALSGGGSERKILRLANRLLARGLSVGVASLNGPDTLAPMLDDAVPRWRLRRAGRFSPAALARLRTVIEQQQPRVVFSVNLYPALYVAAAALTLGSRAPAIIALVNTTDMGRGAWWRQPVYKQVLNRFNRVVYGCEAQQDAWETDIERVRRRAIVIYNGVDLDQFNPAFENPAKLRLQYGYPPDAFVVGSVGRLAPEKNHRALIDAVAQLRRRGVDARLIVGGDGALRQALERQAAAVGVADSVRFTGVLRDVRPLLAALDVFVLPSLYVETFSNAALEAMAMKKPVILSRVGGAAEMISDGEHGYVVEPELLGERLPTLLHELAKDEGRRRAMGERARLRVGRTFSFQQMVDQYASLIERVDR